jgi:hypothetical protein
MYVFANAYREPGAIGNGCLSRDGYAGGDESASELDEMAERVESVEVREE